MVTVNEGKALSEEIAVLLKEASDDQKRQIKCILIGAKLRDEVETQKNAEKS